MRKLRPRGLRCAVCTLGTPQDLQVTLTRSRGYAGVADPVPSPCSVTPTVQPQKQALPLESPTISCGLGDKNVRPATPRGHGRNRRNACGSTIHCIPSVCNMHVSDNRRCFPPPARVLQGSKLYIRVADANPSRHTQPYSVTDRPVSDPASQLPWCSLTWRKPEARNTIPDATMPRCKRPKPATPRRCI